MSSARPTPAAYLAAASESTRLANLPRQGMPEAPRMAPDAADGKGHGRGDAGRRGPANGIFVGRSDNTRLAKAGHLGLERKAAPFGRCSHTSRPYRSKTEARWAAEHRQHEYERVGIRTVCGVYWPDFVCGPNLYEIKGAWIRDRALHKAKAAIRPAKALGFDGIWLAVWADGRWWVTEMTEG